MNMKATKAQKFLSALPCFNYFSINFKTWFKCSDNCCVVLFADDVDGQTYEFGVTSVAERVELQAGDAVQFDVETANGKDVNVKPCRLKLRATVEAVKGTCCSDPHWMRCSSSYSVLVYISPIVKRRVDLDIFHYHLQVAQAPPHFL